MRQVTRREFLLAVAVGIVAAPFAAGGEPARGAQERPPGTDEALETSAGEAIFADHPGITAAVDLGNIPNLPVWAKLTTDTGSISHPLAEVTADGTFNVVNLAGGTIASNVSAGTRFVVTNTGGVLRVQKVGDPAPLGAYTGPVVIQPLDHGHYVRVWGITRVTANPPYRGYLRVEPSVETGHVVVINVLDPAWFADPLEKYLYGVVPREMPVDYGAEALKAQAVAARTYAASRYNGAYVDVTDTTATQVYYGVNGEHPNGTAAVDGTRGVVATYGGNVISALYSSTCGGHTENNENVFFSHVSGGSPAAYLRGVRCNENRTPLNLTTDQLAEPFWSGPQPSFCDWTPTYFRWSVTWTRADLEAILDRYLRDIPADYISPTYSAGTLGEVFALQAVERGVSGKIKRLRVVNSVGTTWDVYSDYYVRYVLRSTIGGGLQYASNIVFTHNRNGDGSLASLVARGGGWGHGIGLCQRGARGMAARGYRYDQILTHYYTGITLSGGPPPAPVPTSGSLYLPGETITLRWTGNADAYHVQVFTETGIDPIRDSGWIPATSYSIGTLALGRYRWQVRGRNAFGEGPFCAFKGLYVVSQIHKNRLPLVYR